MGSFGRDVDHARPMRDRLVETIVLRREGKRPVAKVRAGLLGLKGYWG